MPWMIVKEGQVYCIHKENPDKTAGEKVVCHPNRADAVKQMKAMYANMKDEAASPTAILLSLAYEMAETYGGVKRSDLKSSDFVFGDERAFPVMTAQDVKDAVSSWGRYRGKHSFEDFKRKLKALAKRKGLQSALPSTWKIAEESLYVSVELEGDSLNQRIMAVHDAFSTATMPSLPASEYQDCYIKEVFDNYVVAIEGDKLYKATYSVDADGKVTIQPRADWIEVKQEYVEMSMFLFTELTSSMLKQFDGMAANADVPFVSMSGDEVFIKPEDLGTYVENTRAIIESATTESGEVVGLPIDLDGHDHKGGAGWIKEIELDPARSVIRFFAEWTEEGARVIRDNIRRFFSPSIDPDTKAIRGGSLTNWPASRNGRGQILLRPIELSQNMKGIDMPKTIEELSAEIEKLAAAVGAIAAKLPAAEPGSSQGDGISDEPLSEELQALIGKSDLVDVMAKEAQQRAADVIKFEKRKQHIVEFASKITGGTREKPFGLPVKTGDIVALLLRLPERDSLAVEKVLEKTWHNAIEFTEKGNSGGDFLSLRPLPKEYHSAMRNWVEAGHTPESFFEANPEAGLAGDYNLREFAATREE